MKIINKLFNLGSAFRVLDIMDKCGVDIENPLNNYWAIKPKWYVSKEEAEDLRKIVLYGYYYKNPPKFIQKLFFRNTDYGFRPR